jgi:hypothetical protein
MRFPCIIITRALLLCFLLQFLIPLFAIDAMPVSGNVKVLSVSPTNNTTIAKPHILGPGDILEIKIINNPALDTKQAITDGGSISIPQLGRLTVINLGLPELDALLKKEISKYYKNPEFSVFLTPRPIYIVQKDLNKLTSVVKEAKNNDEANALMGTTTGNMQSGEIYNVTVGKTADFWQDDGLKWLTAAGLIVGIWTQIK